MIEILKVTKDKKKFIVETNEKEYKFSEDVIVEHMVLKGKSFTENEFKKIIKANEVDELFNKTLNFISYQQRSEYEIYSYLKEKGASDSDIHKIIKKLKDFGYIDDKTLANYLFDYTVRTHKGPRALEKKLHEKRIDNETSIEVVNKYTEDIEIDVIEEVLKSILKKNQDKPVKVQKMHAYEKLVRDGFNMDSINRALSKVDFIDNSLEQLPKEIEKLNYKYRDLENNKKREKIIASLMRKGYEYSQVTKYLND